MALTATTSRNPCAVDTFDGDIAGIPIAAGASINQGDFVVWDPAANSGNGGIRTPAVAGDMSLANGGFIGIAGQQNPIASLGDPLNTLQLFFRGMYRMKTTAAEVYKMFTPVYFNDAVDVQTITSVIGTRTAVGRIIIPQQQTMQGVQSVTGVANGDIWVWITPFFPLVSI